MSSKLIVSAILIILASPVVPGTAVAFGWGDTVTVWVDDAHTSKITVPKLDPDQIADPSSLSLGVGKSQGFFGVSIGWSRKKGIDYTEKMEELIEKIRDLCEEFNDGDLSLETYRRRLRAIYESLEMARRLKVELMASLTMESQEAFVKMDEVLGIPPRSLDEVKANVDEAIAIFRGDVDALPYEGPPPESVERDTGDALSAQAEWERELEKTRQSMNQCFLDFKRSVDAPEREESPVSAERITIWKDKARTERITVYKLDVKNIVDDVQKSLTLQYKYSNCLFSVCLGPRTTWALKQSARYDQAAQMLILKYKRLCLEYNSCIISQEEYLERLGELHEAEERAFFARERFAESLHNRMVELFAKMDEMIEEEGGMAKPGEADALEALARMKSKEWERSKKTKAGPSLVDRMSQQHLESMSASEMEQFEKSVDEVDVTPSGEQIEVWVDDAQTRKATVYKIDTDLFAQNVETRLSLHVTWFDFGPEMTWAKKRGIDYTEVCQLLIVKFKQLCMEFNSQLVSLESFDRRRNEIDEAVEKASMVRERMVGFIQKMKEGAFQELERQMELLKERKGGG